MPVLKKTALALVAVLLLGNSHILQAHAVSGNSVIEALLDGHKVINVVDDFLIFWERAKDEPPNRQRRLWRRMVESKHRDYFDRAVYRGANREQRRAMLDWFLAIVPDRIDAIREFNRQIIFKLTEAVIYFKSRFPEYQQKRDIYIGLSMFGFDSSIRAVQNEEGVPDTLCLGAEVLALYPTQQLQIAIAHEFFHLYHFGFLFQDPWLDEIQSPHIRLMIEGLAVAGAEAIYPYEPSTLYLNFSDEELMYQSDELAVSSQRYLELVREQASLERYEQWFNFSSSDEAPLRGGYLLGYEVTKRVLAAFTLEQIVRMTPDQLREHTEEQLAAMATDGILLMAASG